MKKKLVFLCGLLLSVAMLQAQTMERGLFNHLGVGVGVGTEGVSVGVAAPLTKYLEVGAGLNIVPQIRINADLDVYQKSSPNGSGRYYSVDGKGEFGRTTYDFKVNCFPFPGSSSFFVAAGLSFGGKSVVKLTGSSEDVRAELAAHPELRGDMSVDFNDYILDFDDNGEVHGTLEVAAVRPYLGIGFGHLVSKHRIGARFEIGCQFHGKGRVMQGGKEVTLPAQNGDTSLFTDIINKATVYPVLKFQLTGRIL